MFASRLLYLLAALTLQAQSPVPAPSSVPLYRVTIVQSSAKAINYRYMKSSTKIDFKGTVLAPDANGEAKVASEATTTRIKAEFKGLPAPSSFGPEYLTYVLWAVSPEGRASNLGEILVKNGKGKLKVTEPLQTFGLVVTAEPYFAVTQPSDAVILENAIRPDTVGKVELIDAKYALLKRGTYHLQSGANAAMTMDPQTPFDLYQARNAVAIARSEGAGTYAMDALTKAEGQLAQAESPALGKKERIGSAREAIQNAEDARMIAVKRIEVEAQEQDRRLAQAKIDQARQESEAANAAAERARQATAVANDQTSQANAALADADRNQKATVEEMSNLRTQLLAQFNAVLETRATARGLIVNMAGMNFANGKYELLPASREKLAKIAGIILAHPGLHLEADGYTDNVGSDELNLSLSAKRAEAARNYLVQQGVSPAAIVHHGYGKADPVDSNDSASGRQNNRRVELVVTGTGITNDLPNSK